MEQKESIDQEINDFPGETLLQDEEKDELEGEVDAPRGIWQELDAELHKLLQMLGFKLEKKMDVKKIIQEKPSDLEDENAVSTWFDKIIHIIRGDSDEEPDYVRERGISEDDVALKLERFKVKTLNGGNESTSKGDKK